MTQIKNSGETLLRVCDLLMIAALLVSFRKRNSFSFLTRSSSTSHTTSDSLWSGVGKQGNGNKKMNFKYINSLIYKSLDTQIKLYITSLGVDAKLNKSLLSLFFILCDKQLTY